MAFIMSPLSSAMPSGIVGAGTVHHVAWRMADDRKEMALHDAVETAGLRPTPQIDRFWFRRCISRSRVERCSSLRPMAQGLIATKPRPIWASS
jgi:hypothetical protein